MWYIDALNNYLIFNVEIWPSENKYRIEKFCKNIDILFNIGLSEISYPVTIDFEENSEDPEPEMADCFSPLSAKLCALTYMIKYIDNFLSPDEVKKLNPNELLQVVLMAIIVAVKYISDEEFANEVFFPGIDKNSLSIINRKEIDFLKMLDYRVGYDLDELKKIFSNIAYLTEDIICDFKLEISHNFNHINDEVERKELSQLLDFFPEKNPSKEFPIKTKHSPTMFNKRQKDNPPSEKNVSRQGLC